MMWGLRTLLGFCALCHAISGTLQGPALHYNLICSSVPSITCQLTPQKHISSASVNSELSIWGPECTRSYSPMEPGKSPSVGRWDLTKTRPPGDSDGSLSGETLIMCRSPLWLFSEHLTPAWMSWFSLHQEHSILQLSCFLCSFSPRDTPSLTDPETQPFLFLHHTHGPWEGRNFCQQASPGLAS